MTYVFDTSIIIDLERNHEPTQRKVQELCEQELAIPLTTFINRFEFIFGIQEKNERIQRNALYLIDSFTCINTTKRTADILARLRHKYDKLGIKLPINDFIIATIAIENDLTLVTKDKDFLRIKELKMLIW